MARLLRDKDYIRQIQDQNLLQIINSDYSIVSDVEQSAQSEMKSYLTQRYDMTKTFTDTQVFATSSTYYGKNLVEYTESAYDQQTTYAPLDRIVFDDKIYYNSSTMSIIGISPEYTPDWTYITNDKSLYYANIPFNEWVIDTDYVTGDVIWYNNITYSAIQDNVGVVPPDTTYWSVGSTYSFSNIMPENTTYWTKGDNRNQQIVMYLIDITLYHLHSRINPRNVPELRMIRYDGNDPKQTGGALGWLKRVAAGDVSADLPEIVTTAILSVSWGSSPKQNNFF